MIKAETKRKKDQQKKPREKKTKTISRNDQNEKNEERCYAGLGTWNNEHNKKSKRSAKNTQETRHKNEQHKKHSTPVNKIEGRRRRPGQAHRPWLDCLADLFLDAVVTIPAYGGRYPVGLVRGRLYLRLLLCRLRLLRQELGWRLRRLLLL